LQYWGLNLGPTLSATPPVHFCIGFFWDSVSQTICLGWLQTMILLISPSLHTWATGAQLAKPYSTTELYPQSLAIFHKSFIFPSLQSLYVCLFSFFSPIGLCLIKL
jgi:hypothetical protein